MYLRRDSDIFEYNTRRKCDFHVPSCNTSLFKRNVINMGIRDFKRKLKLFLIDHPFYSLNGVFLYLNKITESISNNKM